eukprot:scaffold4801_cov69-Phaeocystis_antarctica.AAC.5
MVAGPVVEPVVLQCATGPHGDPEAAASAQEQNGRRDERSRGQVGRRWRRWRLTPHGSVDGGLLARWRPVGRPLDKKRGVVGRCGRLPGRHGGWRGHISLAHRFPSEQRSEAGSSRGSTAVGDHAGRPGAALFHHRRKRKEGKTEKEKKDRRTERKERTENEKKSACYTRRPGAWLASALHRLPGWRQLGRVEEVRGGNAEDAYRA